MADRTHERRDEAASGGPDDATSPTDDATSPTDDATSPTDDATPAGSPPTDTRPTDGPPADAPAVEGGAAAGERPAEPDWEALAADDPRSRAELLAELTAAEARRDEYLDDVRRARAEFENYRKRVMRESAQQRTLGRGEAVERLLDVLDDFDRTMQATGSGGDGLREGVELVHRKLGDALRGLGVARIDRAGAAFDPERHEAVQRVDADEDLDDPVVEQVLRAGYEIDGRVLRPAMVVVRQ